MFASPRHGAAVVACACAGRAVGYPTQPTSVNFTLATAPYLFA